MAKLCSNIKTELSLEITTKDNHHKLWTNMAKLCSNIKTELSLEITAKDNGKVMFKYKD